MPDSADAAQQEATAPPSLRHARSASGTPPAQPSPQSLRNYILATDRHACVYRELWNDTKCTYLDLRSYIISRKARGHGSSPGIGGASSIHPSPAGSGVDRLASSQLSLMASAPSSSAAGSSFQPTAAYTFVGMRCVFDAAKSAITLVKFANVRSDLLAYADADGGLWVVRDLQGAMPTPTKAPTVHRRAITCLDWSPDNTYLLTASLDGLTVWDVGELWPIRTVATPLASNAISAAIFHCLSANMVLAGTAQGTVDVINASTGAVTLSVPVFKTKQKGVQVSALEVSAHHVFAGDSAGWLHLHKQEIPRPGQLARLVHCARVRVPASEAPTPIVSCQYLPFCQGTQSPALLVTARDSTLAIVKVAKEHLLEVHMRCGVAPMAREIRAVTCPLSVLHCDVPRVVMGSEDTGVHIYNLSAIKAPPAPHRGGLGGSGPSGMHGHGGAAAGAAHGGAAALGRPLLVNTLRGHRAPVATVSWAFDETFLASADCDGMVIVWERAT